MNKIAGYRNFVVKASDRTQRGFSATMNSLLKSSGRSDAVGAISFGKTLVFASTHGNTFTSAVVDGKPDTIELNSYIKDISDFCGSSHKPCPR